MKKKMDTLINDLNRKNLQLELSTVGMIKVCTGKVQARI